MAELLLKEALSRAELQGFVVQSAGIAARAGDTINPKSAYVLSEHGISSENFSSTLLDEKSLKEAFAVVCMTEKQKDILLDMRWHALREAGEIGEEEIENNIYAFSELAGYEVIDPYGKDLECYRYVFGLLAAGMSALIEKLRLPEHAKKSKPRVPRKTKQTEASAPKKRGRPKKQTSETAVSAPPKKRGRPKKTDIKS